MEKYVEYLPKNREMLQMCYRSLQMKREICNTLKALWDKGLGVSVTDVTDLFYFFIFTKKEKFIYLYISIIYNISRVRRNNIHL